MCQSQLLWILLPTRRGQICQTVGLLKLFQLLQLWTYWDIAAIVINNVSNCMQLINCYKLLPTERIQFFQTVVLLQQLQLLHLMGCCSYYICLSIAAIAAVVNSLTIAAIWAISTSVNNESIAAIIVELLRTDRGGSCLGTFGLHNRLTALGQG